MRFVKVHGIRQTGVFISAVHTFLDLEQASFTPLSLFLYLLGGDGSCLSVLL